MAATVEYIHMSQCALFFPYSLTIKPANLEHFLFILTVQVFHS